MGSGYGEGIWGGDRGRVYILELIGQGVDKGVDMRGSMGGGYIYWSG